MNKYVVIVAIAAALAASWYWTGPGQATQSHRQATTVPRQPASRIDQPAPLPSAAPATTPRHASAPPVPTSGAVPPLPEAAPTQAAPDHLQLWDGPFRPGRADQVSALEFKVDPRNLERLRTGQVLSFTLGDQRQPISAELRSTANPSPEVRTWQGAVLDREPQDNLIIARGPRQTHITVFTDATTYSVVVDNTTGEATLVDEGDLHEITVPYEDGIALPEVPDTLPPL